MVQPAEQRGAAGELFSSADRTSRAYRTMVLARVLDEKFASLYRTGKIQGGVFLGRGQEALSVACGMALQRGDVFAPLIRDAAGRLAFGEPLLDAVRTYLGSRLGPMRGRDGNVHRGRPKEGLLPMISHLGAMVSVVNGTLMAHRFLKASGRVGLASLGDGATSTGAFHEALNQAAVERLPLVLVVANNQYAYSTPNSRQFACSSLLDKAAGYGVAGWEVDGTDLTGCLEVVTGAVERARSGDGPQLVLGSLLRLCGHGEHDDATYIDPALKASGCGRDCLAVAEGALGLSAKEIAQWRAEAVSKVEDAVARVQREPAPDAIDEDWCALSERGLADPSAAGSPAGGSGALERLRGA